MLWIALQVAPDGHWLADDGSQMRAHWVGVLEPDVSSTHLGSAVVPFGTSVGQGVVGAHAGEQKLPGTPVIWRHGGGREVRWGIK